MTMRGKARCRGWLFVFLAALGTSAGSLPRNVHAEVSFQEIEESLTCQCGCGLTVHSCNHVDCGSAIPLRKEIREQMSLGKSKEQILAYFEAKYGEKILSAPVARGFNWLAWLMPFAAVGAGGIVVFWTVRRWVSRQRGLRERESMEAAEPMSAQEQERLRAELDRFDA